MSSDPASGDPPLELRLESTAEQVATALRELIIAGRLAPGTHVREGPIAAQLGVSRNTVREATNILVGQGLMRREIHRGAYVCELEADDIRDLYAVRRLVEVAALRELAAGGGDLRRLAEAVEALDEAAASGDVRRILDADLNCHHVLVELIGSDRLGTLFDGVETEIRLSLALATPADVEPAALLEDHRAILGALAAGRLDDAVAVLERHLAASERHQLAEFGPANLP
jgi:DNA-binding GntR family transcriptional regulator